MPSLLSRPPLITKLHQRLVDEALPGLDAHYRMAHPIRMADRMRNFQVKREAAVLITLFEKNPNDFHVIFIKRGSGDAEDKHAGQIAFPGGKKEDGDKDMMFTALRETQEEINLDITTLDVLGSLTPLFISVSKFLVHPFVGYLYEPPVLKRQEEEIEDIFELPLSAFRVAEARQKTQIQLANNITLNHVPCFQVNGHIIWGATAMIMNELLETLG